MKEPVMNVDIAKRFIKAGADVILVPAAGTVPGSKTRELENRKRRMPMMHLCFAINAMAFFWIEGLNKLLFVFKAAGG